MLSVLFSGFSTQIEGKNDKIGHFLTWAWSRQVKKVNYPYLGVK